MVYPSDVRTVYDGGLVKGGTCGRDIHYHGTVVSWMTLGCSVQLWSQGRMISSMCVGVTLGRCAVCRPI